MPTKITGKIKQIFAAFLENLNKANAELKTIRTIFVVAINNFRTSPL